MLNHFFRLFLLPQYWNYRYLCEDCTESGQLEIQTLVRGEVDAVFLDMERGTLLVDAGRHLWRLDLNGNVIDTFAPRGKMYSSGLCLRDDHYCDWVLTGDKTWKKSGPLVDANDLSDEELFARFDRAMIVEFDRRHTKELDWPGAAYLWTKDGMTVLDLVRHNDRIDTSCDRGGYSEGPFEKIGWHDTCFEGYSRKSTRRLEFYRQEHLPDREAESAPIVSKIAFVRDFYYLQDGIWGQIFGRFTIGPILKRLGLPGALPTSYWYGVGYYRLRHQGESLGIKAYTSNEEGEIHYQHAFHLPPPGSPDGLLYIERPRTWDRYSDEGKKVARKSQRELGFYRLRRKADRPLATVPAADDNVIKPGQRATYRTRNSWRPVYTGMIVEAGLWGDIQFYDSAHGSHHYLLHPDAVPAGLHAIPQSMTFHWQDRKQKSAFKLYFGDGRHAWFPNHEDSPDIALEFRFDEPEIVEACQRLDAQQQPIEFEIHFQEIFEVGATLSLWLRNRRERIELKRTVVHHRAPDLDGNAALALYFDKSRLRVEYSRVSEDPGAWPDYHAVADEILARGTTIRECIPLMMQQAAELVLKYTGSWAENGRFGPEAERVFDYFSGRLLAHIGRPDDTDDVKINRVSITSNILAYAIASKNERLCDDVFSKVLGPDFDVTRLQNGTLAYNVACYHALHREKALFLAAARQALLLGKKREQLLAEPDFSVYRDDKDFLDLLESAPGMAQGPAATI